MSGLFCFGLLLSSAAMAEPLVVELTLVSPGLDEHSRQPYISFKMTPESAQRFAEFTKANVGRAIEICIEGKAVMTPVIREPILNGSVQVSNAEWTLRQTKDLSDRLAAGKARIEFEVVKE